MIFVIPDAKCFNYFKYGIGYLSNMKSPTTFPEITVIYKQFTYVRCEGKKRKFYEILDMKTQK